MEQNWLAAEQQAWTDGYRCVAGIDEAGRGALAGPVVAACVVLPPDFVPDGINDSKQLSKTDRERCYHIVITSCIGFGTGIVQSVTIDRINILRATHQAMREALADLPDTIRPDIALIDGLPVHPYPITHRAIVGGDGLCASIAAASIIAKVTRDRLMCELHKHSPQYQFSKHKGYGTADHLRALAEHGPSAEHRRSFKPVAALLREPIGPIGQQVIQFSQLDTKSKKWPNMKAEPGNLKRVGANGENIVRLYLESLGWTMLEENFRCAAGEIDLIAEEPAGSGVVLVFIEVKTRRGRAHGTPISSVDKRKQARIIAVANTYIGLRAAGGDEPCCRFDIAEVWPSPDGLSRVTLHRAAFTA